jgi:group I intron endonuclease
VACDGVEDLPELMLFEDLHLSESLKAAKDALSNVAGVYCIKNLITGALYIGSSTNMGERLVSHVMNYSSNLHLQHATALYGLPSFVFIVIELFEPHTELSKTENRDQLLTREQHWLDWLFNLPEAFRYNFLPIAGSRLGTTHSEESKTKMSASMEGKNTGKEPVNKGVPLTEEQKLALAAASSHRSYPVYFYDDAIILVTMYPSLSATCRAEHANKNHMLNCIRTGKLFRGYLVTYNPLR